MPIIDKIQLSGTVYTIGSEGVTIDPSLDSGSTNAVANSAITIAINAVNDKLGGLSLVKLTQAQYDALATKDSNVLYVIVG